MDQQTGHRDGGDSVVDVLPAEVLEAMASDRRADADVDDWPPQTDEHRCPDAGELAGVHPSDVGFLLERVDLDRVDDHTLVELAAAWQRVASWASGHLATVAGALAERASMNPEWPKVAGKVSQPCVAGEELAMRLGWSRRMGQRLVAQGRAFAGHLAWTGDALARGEIDPVKAAVLVDLLAEEPVEVALAVQDDVLPDAPGLTPTQLRRRVQREVLRLDPAGTRTRHEAARARRRVDRPRMLGDGMAGIWAVLDAADAVAMDNGIDAIARTARNAGDPRTLDQLRADVFRDLALGRVGPPVPAGNGAAGEEGGPERADPVGLPMRAVVNVTVPLSTLLGTSDEPGELAGHGPVHADAARALALGGTWRRIVTDPLSGAVLDVGRTRYRPPKALADHVRHRDRTCLTPGCLRPAHACELDHTTAWNDGGVTADHNLGPECKRDHLLKTHAGFRLDQPEPGTFRLTTPTGHTYVVTPGTDDTTRHLRTRPRWAGTHTRDDGRVPEGARHPEAGRGGEADPPPF